MSAPAERMDQDVLAVLGGDHASTSERILALAAVADLIEAAQIALNYLPENGVSRERLRAALARVEGRSHD